MLSGAWGFSPAISVAQAAIERINTTIFIIRNQKTHIIQAKPAAAKFNHWRYTKKSLLYMPVNICLAILSVVRRNWNTLPKETGNQFCKSVSALFIALTAKQDVDVRFSAIQILLNPEY